MRYPHRISQHIAQIEEIIESWPVEVSLDHVLRWVAQFDSADTSIALRVLRHLNVIGFEDLNSALTVAFRRLHRVAEERDTKLSAKNTLYSAIGGAAKSGSMVSYNFRILNELPEANFLDDESVKYLTARKIENLVLVDDIISTGNQATEEVQRITELVTPLGVRNIFLVTAVGMKEGIEKVDLQTKAHVFSAFEYDEGDTVTCLDGAFYENLKHADRERVLNRLKQYGNLGYGGVGGLVVFYYNVPNSTLPIIWHDKASWNPLFRRARKINGIDQHYREIDAAVETSRPSDDADELSVFVEGKVEEAFFESIAPKLAEILGFKTVESIALGGFYSAKLLASLQKVSSKYVLVLEDDPAEPDGRRERVRELTSNVPRIEVKPVVCYVDWKEVMTEEIPNSVRGGLDEFADAPLVEVSRELEHIIFKRSPGLRARMINIVFPKHIREEAIREIAEKIKAAL